MDIELEGSGRESGKHGKDARRARDGKERMGKTGSADLCAALVLWAVEGREKDLLVHGPP